MMLKILYLALSAAVVFSSCAKVEKYKVELPKTTVMEVSKPWAVVSTPLVRLYKTPGENAEAVSSIWQGCMVRIVARTVQPLTVHEKQNYWYQVEFENVIGWLSETDLHLFEFADDAIADSGLYR